MRGKTMALAVTALMLAPAAARAADSYDIHVILPLTGGGAFVGKGQRDSLETLAEIVNKAGGIGGRPLNLIYHDDQSSPQVAVQLANDVLAEKPVGDARLEPRRDVRGDRAADEKRAGRLLPVAGLPPARRQLRVLVVELGDRPDRRRRRALLPHEGWTKIATLNNTDATGQDNDKAIDEVWRCPRTRT